MRTSTRCSSLPNTGRTRTCLHPIPPEGGWVGEAGLSCEMEKSGRTPEKRWGFKLVLVYPRRLASIVLGEDGRVW